MLQNLSTTAADVGNPLFTPRSVSRRLLVVISADRGLAGSYNANIMRAAEQILRGENGESYRLYTIGRKARDFFKRRPYPIVESRTDLPPIGNYETATELTSRVEELFLSGEVDRVELLYTRFISMMTREVAHEQFLPIEAPQADEVEAVRGYIFEPNAEDLLAKLLPRYANTKMLQAILESLASEHSARMVAMQSANKNAGELIDALVLKRNRLRQAVITRELAEIVGGAEALK